MSHRLFNFLITLTMTALLLTGAVPSFTWEDWQAAGQEDGRVVYAAPKASAEGTAAADGASAGRQEEGSAAAEESGASAVEGDADGDQRIVLPAISIDDSDAPRIHGSNAIVMDLDTGTVIYEKKADKVIEPASLTKILNALVVVENLDMDQEVTVPEDVETEGSVIWLDPGEKITVEELLYGMMLESGNDAAQVLGLTAGGGDLNRFSDLMNARARECGASHTDYANPNGLNEDRDHLNYTTARDLALMAREAMKNPTFRQVVGTARHTIPKTNKSDARKLYNSNVCLWLKNQTTTVGGKEVPFKYKGCNGIKTGFTSDAGFCFVGSAERGGTDFLVVSLGSEDSEQRFQDAIALWNYAFKKYETYPVLGAGTPAGVQRVWGGTRRKVQVGTQRDLGVTIYKGTAEDQAFSTEFRLDDDRVSAPIRKGQKMGQALVFNSKGRLVGAEELYALESMGEGGPLSRIGIADEDLPLAGGIAGALLLLILILILVHRARRRKQRRLQQASIRGELKTMRTSGTGMTAQELTDLTGVEEILPLPKGPARISNEELQAWTSTSAAADQSQPAASRFGGRMPRGGYGLEEGAGAAGQQERTDRYTAPELPKMKITPRTSFMTGRSEAGTGQPLQERTGSMTDEELFELLESTEVYDANQPRRHGRLTDTERHDLLTRTRRGFRSRKTGRADRSGDTREGRKEE